MIKTGDFSYGKNMSGYGKITNGCGKNVTLCAKKVNFYAKIKVSLATLRSLVKRKVKGCRYLSFMPVTMNQ